MGQKCLVTGKKTMVGNRVSHAENKTKRKYRVNLHNKWYWDEETGKKHHLRVSSKGLRTIDKLGLAAALRKAKS